MAREGLINNLGYYEVLKKNEIEDIHLSTLKVMKETGVVFEDEKLLKLFSENGCDVDFDSKRVRFPEKLVMDCLEKTPSEFTVKARDENNNVTLSSGKTSFFTTGAAMSSIDLSTLEAKDPSRKEFYDYIKILESLPNLDIQGACAYFGFVKVPQAMRFLEANAAKIRLSTKAQWEGAVFDNNRFIKAMGDVTGNDVIQLGNPAAPLTLMQQATDNMQYFIENDIAFSVTTGSIAGVTGPASIAGTIITDNANTLATIVMAQLLRSGTKIIAGNLIFVQNMITCGPSFGDIGNSLAAAAFNQMWRYYKVPTFNGPCGWSASKSVDYQAGYELSMSTLINAMSGCTSMNFYGSLTHELTGHPVKAIIDDDIAGMIKRYMKGVEVTEETMATDVINEVGPIPGHFLETEHTFNMWRNECYLPKSADRLSIDDWQNSGKNSAFDIAKGKMEDILGDFKHTALSDSQEKALEAVLNEAREYYRETGLISDAEWELYQEDLNSPDYPFA